MAPFQILTHAAVLARTATRKNPGSVLGPGSSYGFSRSPASADTDCQAWAAPTTERDGERWLLAPDRRLRTASSREDRAVRRSPDHPFRTRLVAHDRRIMSPASLQSRPSGLSCAKHVDAITATTVWARIWHDHGSPMPHCELPPDGPFDALGYSTDTTGRPRGVSMCTPSPAAWPARPRRSHADADARTRPWTVRKAIDAWRHSGVAASWSSGMLAAPGTRPGTDD